VSFFWPKIAQKNHKTIEWQDRKKTTIIKNQVFFDKMISDDFLKILRVVRVKVEITKKTMMDW
jgi:hypothetical protein